MYCNEKRNGIQLSLSSHGMSLVTKFREAIEAATDAALNAYYDTALVKARAARIALTAIPISELSNEKIEHSREDLDLMIRDLTKAASEQKSLRNGMIIEQQIRYTRH